MTGRVGLVTGVAMMAAALVVIGAGPALATVQAPPTQPGNGASINASPPDVVPAPPTPTSTASGTPAAPAKPGGGGDRRDDEHGDGRHDDHDHEDDHEHEHDDDGGELDDDEYDDRHRGRPHPRPPVPGPGTPGSAGHGEVPPAGTEAPVPTTNDQVTSDSPARGTRGTGPADLPVAAEPSTPPEPPTSSEPSQPPDTSGAPGASGPPYTVALQRHSGQNVSSLATVDQEVLLIGIVLALAASVGAGALIGWSRRGWAYRLARPPRRP